MPSTLEIVDAVAPSAAPAGVVVPLRLPSATVVARYVPDVDEHTRRLQAGAGAVISSSDLADLWEFPAGLPVPRAGVSESALDSFIARGLVSRLPGGSLRREFEPCGAVTALFALDRCADTALRRASMLSPIYQRYAVITGQAAHGEWGQIADVAERCGVGVAIVGTGPARVLPAPLATLGRPHVFRWWMTELAYASWLRVREAPTS